MQNWYLVECRELARHQLEVTKPRTSNGHGQACKWLFDPDLSQRIYRG